MKYTNPIIKGFHPDPSICFDGENYFLVTSSFEYFPCLPVFKSKDLVNWEQIGAVIENGEYLDLKGIKNSMGLFAPTIRFHKGHYFVVCTNVSQGNFVCHTTDPEKGWSKPYWIDCPRGIDPSLTFLEDKCFYQLSVMGELNEIIQFEIDPFSGKVLTDAETISHGCGGRDAEAPHIFEKDGWFYLTLAEGGTREGHMVTILRSETIGGPYLPCPANPVLTNRNIKSQLQSVGHADFFADKNGNWWAVALSTRPIKHFTLLGRETILLPVEWQNGWPVVNGNGTAIVSIETARINEPQIEKGSEYNHFTKEKAVSLCLPLSSQFNAEDVTIQNLPSEIKLPDNTPVPFLSVCQEEYKMQFTSELQLDELTNGDFGIMIYKDDYHHCKFGIRNSNGEYSVFTEKCVFDISEEKQISISDLKKLTLLLKSDGSTYHMEIVDEDQNSLLTGQIATRHFSNEAANSPFTGVQIGIFAKASEGQTEFQRTRMTYS